MTETLPMAQPTQKPRNSFPAWRLPNGAINATDAQLDDASSSCERWEWGCAGLVVAAVLAEFFIAGVHPSYDSFLEQWGTAAADAAIALGIVGEVLFSRKDARMQTELRNRSNQKLAAATSRAAQAERETERLKSQLAWRRLSPAATAAISEALAKHPKYSVSFSYVANDPETNTFAHELALTFARNGWKVGLTAGTYGGQVGFGIRIPLILEPDLQAAGIARLALSSAGLEYTGHPIPAWTMGMGEGIEVNGQALQVSSPCAQIYVGPKPTPVFG